MREATEDTKRDTKRGRTSFNGGYDKTRTRSVHIPLGKLSVKFAKAQRAVRKAHVQFLHDSMDLELLGHIHVSMQLKDGTFHVIDGHHRILALRMWGFKDTDQIECVMHPYNDSKNCARLFWLFNKNRRSVTAIDSYICGVEGGMGDHPAVDAIVQGVGYEVHRNSGDGLLCCPTILLWSYKRFGGKPIRKGLELLKGTWGEDHNALVGAIVGGFILFAHYHAAEMDEHRLIDRTEKTWTPGKLLGRANSIKDVERGSKARAVYRALLETYNTKLRNKLKAKA